MRFLKLTSKFAVSAMLMASVSANADFISDWNFEINSGFTAVENNSGATGAGNGITEAYDNDYWNLPSSLIWGSGTAGASSFSVGVVLDDEGNPVPDANHGFLDGDLETNGGAEQTVQLIHSNNPITGSTLGFATLRDQIKLTAVGGTYDGTMVERFLDFDIFFAETTNGGTCHVSTSPTPCNDIFVVELFGGAYTGGLIQQEIFTGGGYQYFANIDIEGFGVLEDTACGRAGKDAGCIGFSTIEREDNTFQVSLSITSREVPDIPEPGTIAMLALGLLGLRAAAKRTA